MSRIARTLSSFGTSTMSLALLALATVFAAGCASATSTKEITLDQADTAPVTLAAGAKPGQTADTKGNVKQADADPLSVIPREPTGTIVGTRVNELYQEVVKLRDQVTARGAQVNDMHGAGASGAIQYYSAVGAIQARLQQGTTPGNPILLRQWDEAQANLDQMSGAVSRLNTASTDISADASLAGYLQDSIRAALQLSGAVDEDHDHLNLLQDVTGRQVVALDRMKTEISNELTGLNTYLATERSNMQTLAFAIEKGAFIGSNLAGRSPATTPGMPGMNSMAPMAMPAPQAPMPPPLAQPTLPVQTGMTGTHAAPPTLMQPIVNPADADARSGTGLGTAIDASGSNAAPQTFDPLTQNLASLPDESGGRTLAIVRFTDPNIAYEQQLYGVVSTALNQSPDALFTVVAVAPAAGNAAQVALGTADAQRHADDVKRSLIQMGLPASRIAMSANGDPEASASEVHVLVR